MTILLIDPPVSPYSTMAELTEWQAELTARRAKYKGDPEATASIDRALADVANWISTHPDRPTE